MDKVNVVVMSGIGEENLRRIAQVSPGINVIDTSRFWDAADLTKGTKDDFSSPEFDALLSQAEVICAHKLPHNIITRAPHLKWVQIMLAGVDHVLTEDMVKSKVVITSVSGIHATPVSETALTLMLILARQASTCFRQKQEKRWQRYTPDILRGKTAGIVGLGHIGRETARLCKSFGMRVVAVRRSMPKEAQARYVDLLLPRERLPELLSQSDYVVMILPLTPETVKMVGEKELKLMKPSAYLINVGRGITVDEEALVRACRESWIAGAGLDAFTIEPLPKESPFWEMPNVFISPHIAGRLKNYGEVATSLVCENMRRYVNGKKLLRIVNKKRGY